MSDVQTGTVTTKVPARLDRQRRTIGFITAAGGIAGPLLFSTLVSTVLAFCAGASLMILAGLVEIFLGVRAERRGLEDIARPLTAVDAAPRPREARVAR